MGYPTKDYPTQDSPIMGHSYPTTSTYTTTTPTFTTGISLFELKLTLDTWGVLRLTKLRRMKHLPSARAPCIGKNVTTMSIDDDSSRKLILSWLQTASHSVGEGRKTCTLALYSCCDRANLAKLRGEAEEAQVKALMDSGRQATVFEIWERWAGEGLLPVLPWVQRMPWVNRPWWVEERMRRGAAGESSTTSMTSTLSPTSAVFSPESSRETTPPTSSSASPPDTTTVPQPPSSPPRPSPEEIINRTRECQAQLRAFSSGLQREATSRGVQQRLPTDQEEMNGIYGQEWQVTGTVQTTVPLPRPTNATPPTTASSANTTAVPQLPSAFAPRFQSTGRPTTVPPPPSISSAFPSRFNSIGRPTTTSPPNTTSTTVPQPALSQPWPTGRDEASGLIREQLIREMWEARNPGGDYEAYCRGVWYNPDAPIRRRGAR